MTKRLDPVAAADPEARALAAQLLGANHAALAYTDADTGTPGISRIAFGLDEAGSPLTLISALAPHFRALQMSPACALMLGEPGAKGDPLTHPRLMIRATARFIANDDAERAPLRDLWLKTHPKSTLYVDFADFAFVRFQVETALLNGGFARAYRLNPSDLGISMDAGGED